MPPADETVLVVGSTSSLAQALARALAERGYGLALAARDEQELAMQASDLRARFSIAVSTQRFDLLDAGFSAVALIENAGNFHHAIIATGDMGNNNSQDIKNLALTAQTNYVLPAQIASVAAAKLAQRCGGSIAIISSVAGDRGRQSNYAYGAAKAGLSAFASGLRNYYFKRGVHVMTVKPGFIDTPMTWGMKSPLIASREYVADAIVKALIAKKDVVYVPRFWALIMLIITHIPEKVFKKLSL